VKKGLLVLTLALAGCAEMPVEVPAVPQHNKLSIRQSVKQHAETYKVPLPLASAIIQIESKFDPNLERKGNYGLGQIRCIAAKDVGFKGQCIELLNVDTNLIHTMKYLRLALDKSQDDWCIASTLYNKGLYHKSKTSAFCQKVLRQIDDSIK
jgi:hypothetical protein